MTAKIGSFFNQQRNHKLVKHENKTKDRRKITTVSFSAKCVANFPRPQLKLSWKGFKKSEMSYKRKFFLKIRNINS